MTNPEISCDSCNPSACCQGGTIELTLEEAAFMIRGGNKLITIAQPADYDRDDVMCPQSAEHDDQGRLLRVIGFNFPLDAGVGRYFMTNPCKYLVETAEGATSCEIYDERPATCQKFEVGGSQCQILRQVQGFDPMTEITEQTVNIINNLISDD